MMLLPGLRFDADRNVVVIAQTQIAFQIDVGISLGESSVKSPSMFWNQAPAAR
jgi:hypothetical protein